MGVCENDGVGRLRRQTEDGRVGMGGKRPHRVGGECHNPHEFLKRHPPIPVRPERSEAKSKDALSHREREFKPEWNRCSVRSTDRQRNGEDTMATSIQLTPDTERRLDLLVSQTGRSKAFYLREMIERGLEDLEDYYLAVEVLERVRAGTEEVYSAAEARKILALDD